MFNEAAHNATSLASRVLVLVLLVQLYLMLPVPKLATAFEPETCNSSVNVGQMIESMMSRYDRQMLPNPNGVNVTIEIHVQEISELSELSADFELDLFYSEIWLDPALSFLNYSFCKTNVTLKSEFRDRIWRPDTCVVNSKKSQIHSSPSENSFVILYEDGTVWVNYRMLVKAPCKMDLKMFPFDSQECHLVFESYSYNSQEVRLQWFTEPVTIMGPIDLPDFSLTKYTTEHFRLEYPNGLWDRLRLTFNFNRRYGFYLFQAYFPTTLTVISSWIGFYLDIKSVSARITLGVSSLLALTFQFGTVLRHLPRVSYIKCLDVWMITCVSFIFFTLVELAIISKLARREREKLLGKQVINRWLQLLKSKKSVAGGQQQSEKQQPMTKENSLLIDGGGGLRPRPSVNSSKWKSFANGTGSGSPVAVTSLNNTADHGFVMLAAPDTQSPSSVHSEEVRTTAFTSSNSTVTERTSLLPLRKATVTFLCLRVRTSWFRVRRIRWEEMKEFELTASQVDEISIIVFPTTFFIFNLVYWCYYFIRI